MYVKMCVFMLMVAYFIYLGIFYFLPGKAVYCILYTNGVQAKTIFEAFEHFYVK